MHTLPSYKFLVFIKNAFFRDNVFMIFFAVPNCFKYLHTYVL